MEMATWLRGPLGILHRSHSRMSVWLLANSYPFGFIVPYAADDLDRPILFISSMAMQTQNLHQDSRVSQLITEPNVSGDPLSAARLTLLGAATQALAQELHGLYLSGWGDGMDLREDWSALPNPLADAHREGHRSACRRLFHDFTESL
jgi:hypothetical protein